MLQINYKFQEAKIENLNLRTEKHGKTEKVTGLDIKIKTTVTSDFLKALSLDKPDYDTFFFSAEDGAVKPHYIRELVFNRDLEDHKVLIDRDLVSKQEMRLINVKIKNFRAIPVFGKQWILTFTIQATPNDTELVFLSHAARETRCVVTIEQPAQVELFDE